MTPRRPAGPDAADEMPMGDVAHVALALPGAGAFLQDSVVSRGCKGTEAKSGTLILVGPAKHAQHVQVKVYRTSLEHFAVVYPQKKVCRPMGFVNLRHTVVARLPAVAEKVHVKTAAAKSKEVRCPSVSLPRQYQHLSGLVVRSRQCDSPHALTFLSESAKELDSWLSAFEPASAGADALRVLPILEEGDEL